jgi:hypothetical protein
MMAVDIGDGVVVPCRCVNEVWTETASTPQAGTVTSRLVYSVNDHCTQALHQHIMCGVCAVSEQKVVGRRSSEEVDRWRWGRVSVIARSLLQQELALRDAKRIWTHMCWQTGLPCHAMPGLASPSGSAWPLMTPRRGIMRLRLR